MDPTDRSAGWWTGATTALILSLSLTAVLTGLAWAVAKAGEGMADRVAFVLLVLLAGATARWFWGRAEDLWAAVSDVRTERAKEGR